jgi:hypothetical protein
MDLPITSGPIAIVNFSPDDRFLLVGLARYTDVEKGKIIIFGVPVS